MHNESHALRVAERAELVELADLVELPERAERSMEPVAHAAAPTADGALPVALDGPVALPTETPSLRAVEFPAAATLTDSLAGELADGLADDVLDDFLDDLVTPPSARPVEATQTAEPVEITAPVVRPASTRAPAFALPVGAGLGLVAALVAGAPVVAALVVAVVWLLVALQQSPSRLVPGAVPWQGLVPAGTAAVAAAGLAVGVLDAPRAAVGASLALVATATLAAVAVRLLRRLPQRRIVVVGEGADIDMAVARWGARADVEVAGVLATDGESVDAGELGDLLDRTGADLVVVCGVTDEATLRRTAWAVESRPVALALAGPYDHVSPHRMQPTRFAGTTLTHVAAPRPGAVRVLVKSAVDRVAALAMIAAFAPVVAVLAVWIRLDSPGPVFFRQTRVGHHGRHFTMWKLRTMVTDAEQIKHALAAQNEGAGVLFKMEHDPRVTGAGRILRKLSLDELPQLINVALGHMSLVGPRPALPTEVAKYDATMRRRLAAKPGMTGLWQISGRSNLSWDESVRLDLHYTDNWRNRDDAMILVRTAGVVFNPRGAY